MKITCVIDSVTSGGAQRQITLLAALLKRRGHRVTLLAYHRKIFFLPFLEAEGVPVHFVETKSKWSRILAMRRAIRKTQPHVVVAFLATPSLLSELAGLPRRKFALVVSERTGTTGTPRKGERLKFQMHRFADAVVTNGPDVKRFMDRVAPYLASRTHVIGNCVDLDRFVPPPQPREDNETRVLVIGRIRPEKNPAGLVAAMALLQKQQPRENIRVDWYGSNFFQKDQPTERSEPFLTLKKQIETEGIKNFQFHEPVTDVLSLYHSASVVCMPSFWEGCSNVLCEALACGLPLLAGRVSDNHLLVREGENGFLFDPNSPEDMAATVSRFAALPANTKRDMGLQSRRLAQDLLSPDRFVDQYLDLFRRLVPGSL